ncbi:MAG: hypothetical protein RIC55_28410 [Pirellulaceae bacterium]
MVKGTDSPAVEIEIDGPSNEALHFRPLQRSIRGRFDMNRIGEPMARVAATKWPTPIPSQRLGIDANGNGYLIEPLHDIAHAPTREKIDKTGKALEPARQTFDNIDLCTWAFWLRRAVEGGLARVVSGKLPEVEGTPRMNFILHDPGPSQTDTLAEALNRQADAFNSLAAAIADLAKGRK